MVIFVCCFPKIITIGFSEFCPLVVIHQTIMNVNVTPYLLNKNVIFQENAFAF
jgi:hypothetical protein